MKTSLNFHIKKILVVIKNRRRLASVNNGIGVTDSFEGNPPNQGCQEKEQ